MLDITIGCGASVYCPNTDVNCGNMILRSLRLNAFVSALAHKVLRDVSLSVMMVDA